MKLIDLTHSITRKKATASNTIPVVVRSVDQISHVPLARLVTLAVVADVTDRPCMEEVTRADIMEVPVSDIGGCIIHTGWSDKYLAGWKTEPPVFSVDAAAHLLANGVRTVACDFPITAAAEDLLVHNDCVLVYCLSNVYEISKSIVRLIALPLKLDDTFSAEARVIAIEE